MIKINNPNNTLIIIDMQEKFMTDAGTEEIIPNICLLIEHAIQNNWPIIVVEFKLYGNTNHKILQTIEGYPHQETIIKNQCNGGQKVIDCIDRNPTWSLNLVVCGIFGDACVPDTIKGVFDASIFVEVDVVYDAIYPEYLSFATQEKAERVITIKDIGISIKEVMETVV